MGKMISKGNGATVEYKIFWKHGLAKSMFMCLSVSIQQLINIWSNGVERQEIISYTKLSAVILPI